MKLSMIWRPAERMPTPQADLNEIASRSLTNRELWLEWVAEQAGMGEEGYRRYGD